MKKILNRYIFILVIFVCGLLILPLFEEEITGGFRLSTITHDFPANPEWQLDKPSDKQLLWLEEVLNQPYHWLGQGHQVFAFVSQDQQYVLKIFKFKRLKPSWIMPYVADIPFLNSYYAHWDNRRLGRIQKLFSGYKLAYTQDQEHTGLLFLHLDHKEKVLTKPVRAYDKLGFSHSLDVNSLVFAIQKRAIKTKDVLKTLLNNRDVEGTKQYIRNLFDLYLSGYKRGIIDNDQNVVHNTGFIGDRPIRLDIGQLKFNEMARDPTIQKADLSKIVHKRLIPWLRSHYPEMEPEITQDMLRKLSESLD